MDVSAATVSRALRHDTLIHPETRARVNEAALRLGYKSRARRPRRVVEDDTKSRTLGLLLRHNSLDAARHDMNLMKMMSGIMGVTDSNRVLLQMHTIGRDEARSMVLDPSAVPPLAEPGVCQAFIVHGEQDERDIAFLAERAPVVSMGRVYRNLPVDAVVGDNVEGVREMVAHLVELGHRRLAWVGASLNASFMEARQSGFIQGCLQHGIDIGSGSFHNTELLREVNIHAPNGILETLGTGVTGFVCGSDGVANRLAQVLERVGRRVPEDVSVTGFDAINSRDYLHRFTSIDPHFVEIGQVAAQLALHRIVHASTQPCITSVRGELVRGETTAPVKETV